MNVDELEEKIANLEGVERSALPRTFVSRTRAVGAIQFTRPIADDVVLYTSFRNTTEEEAVRFAGQTLDFVSSRWSEVAGKPLTKLEPFHGGPAFADGIVVLGPEVAEVYLHGGHFLLPRGYACSPIHHIEAAGNETKGEALVRKRYIRNNDVGRQTTPVVFCRYRKANGDRSATHFAIATSSDVVRFINDIATRGGSLEFENYERARCRIVADGSSNSLQVSFEGTRRPQALDEALALFETLTMRGASEVRESFAPAPASGSRSSVSSALGRGLTGCLQMIVRDETNIDVEAQEVEYGELRPVPFAELTNVLTPDQRVSLALLAIADLAVWPQIEPVTAKKLSAALATAMLAPIAVPAPKKTPAALAASAAARLLAYACAPDDDDLPRRLVHELARTAIDPVAYWEEWLRRVVPQVARYTPDEARNLARAALDASLAAPARWDFATRSESHGCTVGVVAVKAKKLATEGADTARFDPYRVIDRRLETSMHPLVPIDAYRMGYLFRTVFIDRALDDIALGSYDEAVCTNAETGETWSFPAL